MQKFTSPKVSVLVVEDDKTTMDLLTRLLTAMGAEAVFQAADGSAGLRSAAANKPTLAICDLEMEPVDGMAFLGGMRSSRNQSLATTPVIMFTSERDKELEVRAGALGVEGYFIKPFSPRGLAGFLDNVACKRLGIESKDDEIDEPE